MLVFIDESGDTGLKIKKGSSRYFTLVLVTFEENEDAIDCDNRIGLLRKEMGYDGDGEFKFNKMRSEQRVEFIEAVLPYDFFYYGIVINKDKLRGRGFQFKESFYKYTCKLVFENAKSRLRDATIVVDGSGSRAFKQQFKTYLRKKIGGNVIKKVKIQSSHNNNLIQLADIVAGAVQRSFSKKEDRDVYRSLLGSKEIYVQVWPKIENK